MLLLSTDILTVVGSTLAVQASLTVHFMPTNVLVESVARTAWFIGLRARVITTMQGTPEASQKAGPWPEFAWFSGGGL